MFSWCFQNIKSRRDRDTTCDTSSWTKAAARRTRAQYGNDETARKNSTATSGGSIANSTATWSHLPPLQCCWRQEESQHKSIDCAPNEVTLSQRKSAWINDFNRQQTDWKFTQLYVISWGFKALKIINKSLKSEKSKENVLKSIKMFWIIRFALEIDV